MLIFAYSAPIFAESADDNLFESCALVVTKDSQSKSAPFQLLTRTPELKVYGAEVDGYSVRIEHNNGQLATMTNEGLAYKAANDRYEDSKKPIPVEEDPAERAQFETEHQARLEKLERMAKRDGMYPDLQRMIDDVKSEKYEPTSKRLFIPPPYPLAAKQFYFQIEHTERGVDPAANVIASDDQWESSVIDSEQKIFDMMIDQKTGVFHGARPPQSAAEDMTGKNILKPGAIINCVPQL
jgi:hypothetical protein